MSRFAKVIPDRAGDRALDYAIPPALQGSVRPGSRVRVPLRMRLVQGTVIDVADESDVPGARDIHDLIGEKPLIKPKLFELGHWLAEYYCCSVESAMACLLPQVVRKAQVSAKKRNVAKLLRPVTEEDFEALEKRAPRQAEALRILQDTHQPTPIAELSNQAGLAEGIFRTLEKNGWVTIESEEFARDPHAGETFLPTDDLVLNPEQQEVMRQVRIAMESPAKAKPILLHGVTGSGKTEIYLQTIKGALEAGLSALVLVPEISLTPQTVERFKARFSHMQSAVAVLHSHLSDGERYDEWYKIHNGEARIVIGARSAVFAPLDRLGIIIVDEEHESSYKQEENPRYNARDVAVLRANKEGCPIILGSATPSIESWQNTQLGKYQLLRMALRVDDRQMPVIRVIDMRKAARRAGGGEAVFSVPLVAAIEKRLAKKEQTILFLNRRGFSTTMLCQACGHICTCPNCSVSLTYHRDAQLLSCHICGHNERAPKVCPECRDEGIRHAGTGTQRVEDVAKKLFHKARVARMDADAMTKKDSYAKTLGAFKKGEIDILIGTQMIAKGLHFPNVTLVGIVNADLGLHVPDFRAGERTFQLLTQVAGRAGRGEMEGEVVVQAFTPESPSIQFARHHDFEGFVEQELAFRENFGFPPYARMILITVRSEVRELAEFTTQTLVRKLKEVIPSGVTVGEAMPAPLEKAKGYFRFQTVLRGPSIRPMSRVVQSTLAALNWAEDVYIAVDVDPMQLT